jgi:hypothetical protein
LSVCRPAIPLHLAFVVDTCEQPPYIPLNKNALLSDHCRSSEETVQGPVLPSIPQGERTTNGASTWICVHGEVSNHERKAAGELSTVKILCPLICIPNVGQAIYPPLADPTRRGSAWARDPGYHRREAGSGSLEGERRSLSPQNILDIFHAYKGEEPKGGNKG